jgi:hypothetical protein
MPSSLSVVGDSAVASRTIGPRSSVAGVNILVAHPIGAQYHQDYYPLFRLERLRDHFVVLAYKYLDPRLGFFELLPASFAERNAFFEQFERTFKRQVAAFQFFHDGFQLREAGLEALCGWLWLVIIGHSGLLYQPLSLERIDFDHVDDIAQLLGKLGIPRLDQHHLRLGRLTIATQ